MIHHYRYNHFFIYWKYYFSYSTTVQKTLWSSGQTKLNRSVSAMEEYRKKWLINKTVDLLVPTTNSRTKKEKLFKSACKLIWLAIYLSTNIRLISSKTWMQQQENNSNFERVLKKTRYYCHLASYLCQRYTGCYKNIMNFELPRKNMQFCLLNHRSIRR
jgi:hypothetical protein